MRVFLQAFKMLIVLTFITGIVYPLCVTLAGGLLFPYQAKGSLVYNNGVVVGSELIGQKFTDPKFFHSRPSASDYDAMQSGGSNLAFSNKDLYKQVELNIKNVRDVNLMSADVLVPTDLLTASASGLDPHISKDAAMIQVKRIAQVRGLSEEQVGALVDAHGNKSLLNPSAYVNVLVLNVALEQIK